MAQRIALKEKTIICLNEQDGSSASRFIINQLIGNGGSCLVYSVNRLRKNSDQPIGRSLILKECFPISSDATRNDDDSIEFPDEETRDFYIQQFNEAYEKAEQFYDLLDGKQILIPSVKELYGNGTVYRLLINEGGNDLQYVRDNEKKNGFSRMETIRIMLSLCSAANRLHQNGYYYLDYKPENIYLKTDDSEHVYLFDFDSIMSESDLSEHPEDISCTFRWAPPELYPELDPDRISACTDIYELGEIFLWLLSNKEPDSKDKNSSFEERIEDIRKNNPFGVSEAANNQIVHILENTLCENEGDRFATVDELSNEFNRLKNMLEGKEENLTIFGLGTEIKEGTEGNSNKLDDLEEGQKKNKKLLIGIAALLIGAIALIVNSALSEPEAVPSQESTIQTAGRIEIPGYSEDLAAYNESNGYITDTALISIEVSLRRVPKYSEQVFVNYDNEKIRFRIHYVNHSGESKRNIILRAILPDAINYEEGSTTLFNYNHPKGVTVSDNLVKDSGMNIGDYTYKSDVWIYFNATINSDEVQDGNTIFRNIIQVNDGVATYENTADVLVSKASEILLKSYLSGYTGSDWADELTTDVKDEFTVYMLLDNDGNTDLMNPLLKAVLPDGFEYVEHSAEVSYMDAEKGEVKESISDDIFADGATFKAVGPGSNILISYKVRISDAVEKGSKHTITSIVDIGEQALRDNVYIYIND